MIESTINLNIRKKIRRHVMPIFIDYILINDFGVALNDSKKKSCTVKVVLKRWVWFALGIIHSHYFYKLKELFDKGELTDVIGKIDLE